MKKDLHSSAVAINGENINHLRSGVLRLMKLKWITIWKNAIIFEGFVLLTFSHSICSLCLCFWGGGRGTGAVLGLGACSLHPPLHNSLFPLLSSHPAPQLHPTHKQAWISPWHARIIICHSMSDFFLFVFLRDPLRQAFNLGINKEFTCCLFIDLLALKALFI